MDARDGDTWMYDGWVGTDVAAESTDGETGIWIVRL